MPRPLFRILMTAVLLLPAIGQAQPTDLETYALFRAARCGSS